jgi:ADP-ribose pyrophosphatase YjhB (NUDIX family)
MLCLLALLRPAVSTRTLGSASREYSLIPRAAVAISVRRSADASYLLILRGKPPGQGQWSLPGGGIELGEETAVAARRELLEECGLDRGSVRWSSSPFTTTDAIYCDSDAQVQFHYLIAQYYCEANDGAVPIAGDDALDARWWTLEEVARGAADGSIAGNCEIVLERAEGLRRAGLLRCALLVAAEPPAA